MGASLDVRYAVVGNDCLNDDGTQEWREGDAIYFF